MAISLNKFVLVKYRSGWWVGYQCDSKHVDLFKHTTRKVNICDCESILKSPFLLTRVIKEKPLLTNILNRFGFISLNQADIMIKESIKDSNMIIPAPTRNQYNGESWSNYWNDAYSDNYNAWYISKAINHPKILSSFLKEFSSLNYKDIQLYMSSKNWYWNDEKTIPSINEIKNTIIHLFGSCFSDGMSFNIESGGINLKMTDDNVVITFDKKEFYV